MKVRFPTTIDRYVWSGYEEYLLKPSNYIKVADNIILDYPEKYLEEKIVLKYIKELGGEIIE